ncbi:MAG: squalene--hopene cyclase [Phycisphaerales bacterium]
MALLENTHKGRATREPDAALHQSAMRACNHARDALLSLQKHDGHWCGELQGDSILASEYILMKFILGHEREPMHNGDDGPHTLHRIAHWLRSMQQPSGAWVQYPGAAIDISATVKGYFALKLLGENPQSPHMLRARQAILDAAGAERCNSFTNFYLACLGQISWNAVPTIPPEIIYLPRWFFFHMDKVSAWTRTMILPLSLVTTLRPTRRLPHALGIDELFVSQRDRHRLTLHHRPELVRDGVLSWSQGFQLADRGLKMLHTLGGSPFRRKAVKDSLQWIVERAGAHHQPPRHAAAPHHRSDRASTARTDGLGAIFPPMVYIQIALQALGYGREHPLVRQAERELDRFFINALDHIRIQPCFSPVWDTGIALYALADCNEDAENHEHVQRACQWLRSKQIDFRGDWVRNLSEHSASLPKDAAGWAFEYHNSWYPDVDDTAMVAMALRRAGGQSNEDAARRGVAWILAMQNDDGGWAAFDRTRDRPLLEKVPFADHNAMQDPSCPDITGRVLECLAWHGYTIRDDVVTRAVEYVKSKQEPEGCWFGRWGVNYIYGTWQAVIGPIRCGVPRGLPWIQRAGEWIASVQKDDGSFGESADSYVDPMLKGIGPSTASQTAWAAMILNEVFGPNDGRLERAIAWLVEQQMTPAQAADAAWNVDRDPPGSWKEIEYTGTGFPRVFYLRYHMYRLYFPLMALARFTRGDYVNSEV